MNNCDLRGLRWSVSVQRNTYGEHYKLRVAAVKCMTTGHKRGQTGCSNHACNVIYGEPAGLKWICPYKVRAGSFHALSS